MRATLRHYASVAWYSVQLAIQSQIEYPLFLVSWLIMIPIQYFSGIWMISILVDQFQPLAGWTFPELAFLFGLSLLSHAMQVIFFIQAQYLDSLVNHGEFDRMLVRPINIFFQFTVQRVNLIGLIDLIPGISIFLYACQAVGFAWTPLNMLKILAVVVGGGLLRSALFLLCSSTAFWTQRSSTLTYTCWRLLERGTQYPLSLYPSAVQWLMTWLVPIGFIAFYPAVDLLGRAEQFALPGHFAFWSLAVGVLVFCIAMLVFYAGLRRYESAGS